MNSRFAGVYAHRLLASNPLTAPHLLSLEGTRTDPVIRLIGEPHLDPSPVTAWINLYPLPDGGTGFHIHGQPTNLVDAAHDTLLAGGNPDGSTFNGQGPGQDSIHQPLSLGLVVAGASFTHGPAGARAIDEPRERSTFRTPSTRGQRPGSADYDTVTRLFTLPRISTAVIPCPDGAP